MKTDIKNRNDLVQLMTSFYDKVLANQRISYIFTDIAKINMNDHLPVIVDFWEMILFQKGAYQKNVMIIHQALNERSPFTKEHFTIWLACFNETIDALFEGHNALIAKQRALSIATMMQIKMH